MFSVGSDCFVDIDDSLFKLSVLCSVWEVIVLLILMDSLFKLSVLCSVWEVIVLLILMESLFKLSVLCSVWEVIVLLILMDSLFKLSVLCSVWEVIVLLILTTHCLNFLFYVQCGKWLFGCYWWNRKFKQWVHQYQQNNHFPHWT
jgi:hypothetical protein